MDVSHQPFPHEWMFPFYRRCVKGLLRNGEFLMNGLELGF